MKRSSLNEESDMKAKILIFDIETTPSLVWSWDTWSRGSWRAIRTVQDWYVLCFAAKWQGKKTKIFSLDEYGGYKKNRTNDYHLMLDMWNLLDEADIVVGWNSKAFDVKKVNARFLIHGFNPPSPYKQIDVMAEKKKIAKSNSNTLGDSVEEWGLGQKLETEGFDLWEGCMNGDEKHWAKMRHYCVRDVDVTAKAYDFLAPWMATHPNLNVYSEVSKGCPVCQKGNTLIRRGFYATPLRRRQRYHCAPNRGGCGKYCMGPLIPGKQILIK